MPSVHPIASLAATFHGGQSSALYSLVSCFFADREGSVDADTFTGAASELRRFAHDPAQPDGFQTAEALALLFSHSHPLLACGYVDAALFTARQWTGEGEDGDGEAPESYESLEFPPDKMKELLAELDDFLQFEDNAALIEQSELGDYSAGGNTWFSTRGHGTGWFDEDGEAAHTLQKRCRSFRGEDLTVYDGVIS